VGVGAAGWSQVALAYDSAEAVPDILGRAAVVADACRAAPHQNTTTVKAPNSKVRACSSRRVCVPLAWF